MNTKYAVALILALQVSMSLCDIPAPDQELVDKYNELKATFYRRILNLYGRVQSAAAPALESYGQSEGGQTIRNFAEQLQGKPELQAFVKVAGAAAEEMSPLVDRAREALLGLYGHYVRPTHGQRLSDFIDHLKVYLDQYMPAQ